MTVAVKDDINVATASGIVSLKAATNLDMQCVSTMKIESNLSGIDMVALGEVDITAGIVDVNAVIIELN